MLGKGLRIVEFIIGRYGGIYYIFGDYVINLFEYIEYYVDLLVRVLYDMVVVVIVKLLNWVE